ncbi:Ig-like domain-containing protein [Bacillus rubiinfantis]|uniref:Ig-like domain-containing protein n=1 Tax=Bacillus rubiinfantis TaxID=1499680 RepID=UPI000AF89B0D|nr:Ig-like domain-containing protein [Bacillus rubiinfantis]
MRKLFSILLVLQLFILPSAGYAQGGKVVSSQEAKSLNARASVDKNPKQAAKKEADYKDPSSYPLIGEGNLIATLLDSYSTYHAVYYMNTATSPSNSDDMRIRLLYNSEYSYAKDRILTIEFFKESNNTLQYDGYVEFDTYGRDEVYLNSNISKSDFVNQPYIYMRLGISEYSDDIYYSDVTTFKVKNPFYTGNSGSNGGSAYAVISNESIDGDATQPTGTFQLKNLKRSLDQSGMPGKYKLDVNKPFDIKGNKEKRLQKSTKAIQKSYNVGDSKYFWVSNLETESDYQISAKLTYSGTKANVWVNNNQITNEDAAKLGQEFDSSIYPTVTNNFGDPSDVDGDGKINILIYDIQDGFFGSGGYVAGYFWAGDLYNISGSNKSEIFYIDTYPTMGSSQKDVTQAYETLAHEFQHMVNFNRNVLVENSTTNMDTWLNEGLSMAAEQVYKGIGLQDRIDYYNSSSAIQNGHSLLYWDDDGDTLSNYSLSYLFVQYVKKQAGRGDAIFKEIVTDSDNNYKAIEDVAKKYISPDMTFGKLMTDFRIALLRKDPNGLYGFKGDPFFDSLQAKVYSGNSLNLRGGGAVVTTYDPALGLSVPANKGQDVTYTLLAANDSGETGTNDSTPPNAPVVSSVTDSDIYINGTAEPSATVYAVTEKGEIGRTTSRSSGSFTIQIPKQTAGTTIDVYAQDTAGNVSEAAHVIVKDVTAPAVPKVDPVSDKSKQVTGSSEAKAIITVTIGKAVYSSTAEANGKFKINIPLQKAGVKVSVTASDGKNISKATVVTVQDKTAPTFSVNEFSNKSKELTGKAEPGVILTAIIGSKKYPAVADGKGYFKITIGTQKAGTKITIMAQDTAKNISSPKVITVVDRIAPVAPTVATVSNKTKTLTGKAEARATVTVTIGKKKYVATADSKGSFKVAIPVQKAGVKFTVTAKDEAGNSSSAKTVTVVDRIAPATPTIKTAVKSTTKTITGTAEANSTITVKVGKKVIGTAKVSSKGKFTVKIKAQKRKTVLNITAEDRANNISKAKVVRVK